MEKTWFHVWDLDGEAGEVWETDIPSSQLKRLKNAYLVDPDADYWSSI